MDKIEGLISSEGRQRNPEQKEPWFFLNDGEGHTLKLNKDWQLLFMLKYNTICSAIFDTAGPVI